MKIPPIQSGLLTEAASENMESSSLPMTLWRPRSILLSADFR